MEQYGVTTRSGKTRTSPRGNDDSDEDTRTKTDSPGNTTSTETNTWSAGTDATYSNGGSTESASRETSHPRDVTNDDQSTRAHDDPSNKADTSKKSHNKRLQLEATRRLQELELREIRAAKALAKTDRALGQLYDDEECLDTCHETVEIPTDRSRTTFESQTADETAGDKGTRTNEHVRAPSRETENLTRALTDALSFLRSDQKPAPPKYLHELPNFYGEINEWIAFRTVYRDTQCHFTESQNVARLRKALKGDARENVKSLLYSGASADDILDSLQRYFGRPEILILNELENIKKMPKLAEDGRNMNVFASKIVNCVASIKALENRNICTHPS
ncbi:hypothetical protein EVAR_84015_1 [Eumeta japonica]|uniref:Uncharacterized protein n=1 Tax=Eumeta variegata TaxID=151549 RepID=A0A4C1X702_EUMVA|nr:hypothetical protein EVAR_84015_1 [Eumeta japonica]